MELLLILFLPIALASGNYEYKGFDSCGLGGWSCRNTPQGYEVIYRCSNYDRDARIWMWTARIPGSATTLAIENCNHVEIHPDCTMGYRGYTMRTFRASNITELEFLKPLAPYVFLHDNDQEAHMPPEVIIENVGKFTVFAGAFDKAGRRCRTKQQQLETFTVRNVTMHQFLDNKFSDQNLKTFELDNVKFGEGENLALSINANVSITETNFENVTSQGTMTFNGFQVTIKNNNFGVMNKEALTVKCYNFQFEGNTVLYVGNESFDILATNVSIVSNNIFKTGPAAFARIKPGIGPIKGFQAAKKAVFKLDGNEFQHVDIISLHPDIHAYNDTCYEFIVTNNQLPCTCPSPMWLTVIPSEVEFFYRRLFVKNDNNTCHNMTPSCNLAEAMPLMKDCSLLQTCGSPTTSEATTMHTTQQTTVKFVPLLNTTTPIFKPTTVAPPSKDSRVSTPTADNSKKTVIILVVCGSVLVLSITSGIALYYCYKTKKNKEVLGTVYQNQCRSDYDEQNLIDEYNI